MPGESGRRLFIAVNLSLPVTRRVAEAASQLGRVPPAPGAGAASVAWVPPANLHVTLKFLGWTREHAVAAVRDRLRQLAPAHAPFELEAGGGGAFPEAATARVLWAGLRDPSSKLALLVADVEAAMVELGFPGETRPFVPHVTLARLRGPTDVSGWTATLATQQFGTSTVREMVLYESAVKTAGSEYSPLARVRLGEPPDILNVRPPV